MFRSSTKITFFFPAGGPYTPRRRFSNFESNKSWSWFTCVSAEKLMNRGTTNSGASFCSHSETYTDLPVPVLPATITCLSFNNNVEKVCVSRIESTVGTTMFWYSERAGTVYLGAKSCHLDHMPSRSPWISYTKSYQKAFSGRGGSPPTRWPFSTIRPHKVSLIRALPLLSHVAPMLQTSVKKNSGSRCVSNFAISSALGVFASVGM
mmetsp:Transcript_66757/g.204254  ORF Transcript_66757/g.204254 Transcript_66757/m.204254 type:complete len:207 (-) Transcript_66757:1212-1832(-)